MILAEALVRSHVEALRRKMPQPQAAVLGCTHYPLLEAVFQQALGPNVTVLSQPSLVARSLAHYLARHPEMAATALSHSAREPAEIQPPTLFAYRTARRNFCGGRSDLRLSDRGELSSHCPARCDGVGVFQICKGPVHA